MIRKLSHRRRKGSVSKSSSKSPYRSSSSSEKRTVTTIQSTTRDALPSFHPSSLDFATTTNRDVNHPSTARRSITTLQPHRTTQPSAAAIVDHRPPQPLIHDPPPLAEPPYTSLQISGNKIDRRAPPRRRAASLLTVLRKKGAIHDLPYSVLGLPMWMVS